MEEAAFLGLLLFFSLLFIEPPFLALAGCIPAEPVSFLKGYSNVAKFQDGCKLFIVFIVMVIF